eukprot:5678424-Amphidinium_carterae.1
MSSDRSRSPSHVRRGPPPRHRSPSVSRERVVERDVRPYSPTRGTLDLDTPGVIAYGMKGAGNINFKMMVQELGSQFNNISLAAIMHVRRGEMKMRRGKISIRREVDGKVLGQARVSRFGTDQMHSLCIQSLCRLRILCQ